MIGLVLQIGTKNKNSAILVGVAQNKDRLNCDFNPCGIIHNTRRFQA